MKVKNHQWKAPPEPEEEPDEVEMFPQWSDGLDYFSRTERAAIVSILDDTKLTMSEACIRIDAALRQLRAFDNPLHHAYREAALMRLERIKAEEEKKRDQYLFGDE